MTEWIARCFGWLGHIIMPLVTCYHLLIGNVFLNTAATDAKGLEKLANGALIPFQYLFAGRIAVPCQEKDSFCYVLQQRFTYQEHLVLKSTLAILALPVSVALGSALKGLSYLSAETQARHFQIAHAFCPEHIRPNTDLYAQMGINTTTPTEKIPSQGYIRKPGDENNLRWEKEAFREIVSLLNTYKIPFWADCGTCLGAYRYGGSIPWDEDIDFAILEPDFDNVRNVLQTLDKSKYLIEDWSGRTLPKTYLRVYVRKTRTYIDIYCFAIHKETSSVQCILSHADSFFVPSSWKQTLERFETETPISVLFPFKIASFDGIDLPVPNQTKKYLQMRYGEDLSPVKIFDSKTGAYKKDLEHPYWQKAAVR